ncbi:MAG: TIGR03118 family protein [Bacteroidota bacterium]|nr:TIGR03118 family protein [Bacteroidota bacterium]MDP4217907.1 TIGR03118 family protein [Bacteroidota bacterium]MDP4247690.1 TIGR03118 family protein [Bacteroidota bacterium]MDP4253880.1 TIGR03118 family protein [Bacteroidota bacterium]MDP4260581.1 TIGR03118 family protein [Bacteroidota bacterium]
MSKIVLKEGRLPVRAAVTGTALAALMYLAGPGCRKTEIPVVLLNGFQQTNLVSDVPGWAARTDTALVNPWGIAEAPSGPIWISDNGTGLSSILNNAGALLRPPVTIPTPDDSVGGTPTGIVFNNTSDFSFMVNKQKVASKFIFATEDGIIAAWGGGNGASVAADQSWANAVYKGLALAQDGGNNFLYATNFHEGRIDVFDKNFQLVTGKPFHDPAIPHGFAPFNIRLIGSWLYVTYAKQKGPENKDDDAGFGNGFVDIFKTDGSLVKRFATRGALNSPWGIVQASEHVGNGMENAILIGNFGDGRINVYDDDGRWVGPLKDNGRPISIDGLWSLENNLPATDSSRLYFTAGPQDESHGLFGYLQRR